MDHLKYKLLTDLVQAMLDNDPDELVADGGVTMLDVWRGDARRLLGPATPRIPYEPEDRPSVELWLD